MRQKKDSENMTKKLQQRERWLRKVTEHRVFKEI